MRPYEISHAVKPSVALQFVPDVADSKKVFFEPKVVETDPDYVWDYNNTTHRAELLRSGNLKIGSNFLDTDFGNRALLKDLLTTDSRSVIKHSIIIAPWSHYWGSYSDFLMFVVTKLARIKTVLPAAQFDEAIVLYPLFQTPFETEFLALLGINADRLFDSRKQAVQFDRCIVANNSSWFYPTAADLLALKSIVEAKLPPAEAKPEKRLYISRKGRRKVINEQALTTMLSRYGFDVIEDKPRSVLEQIELYRSASFVVGPHGASFANILWCRPGVQLLELFMPSYRPEYFRYLAHVLGVQHAAYCFGPAADSHYTFVDADIEVSVDEVERGINNLLEQATSAAG